RSLEAVSCDKVARRRPREPGRLGNDRGRTDLDRGSTRRALRASSAVARGPERAPSIDFITEPAMKRISTLFALALVFALVACGPPRRQIVSAAVAIPSPPVEEPPPEPEPEPVRMEGDTITIDQTILFAFDSAEILGDSATILDHLAAFIIAHADGIPALEIIGHTDAQGSPRHNQELSQGRAESVAAALRERGVQVALTPIGRGQSEPL